jgi:Flp pilus assembly protein CpaB
MVRALARLAGWPRRVLAAGLALTAIVLLLRPDAPAGRTAAPAGVAVVVVARDLAAGAILTAGDVRAIGLPATAVPVGAARDVRAVVGRILAGPVRRGEPITDARLLGPGLTAGLGPAESTAVPVRLDDPDTAALVRPGDRVDVLGTPVQPDGAPAATGDAVTIAAGVRVLAVLRAKDGADGALVVVATAPSVGRRLTGAAAGHRLTVAVRPP